MVNGLIDGSVQDSQAVYPDTVHPLIKLHTSRDFVAIDPATSCVAWSIASAYLASCGGYFANLLVAAGPDHLANMIPMPDEHIPEFCTPQ